jgi:actin-related protein
MGNFIEIAHDPTIPFYPSTQSDQCIYTITSQSHILKLTPRQRYNHYLCLFNSIKNQEKNFDNITEIKIETCQQEYTLLLQALKKSHIRWYSISRKSSASTHRYVIKLYNIVEI